MMHGTYLRLGVHVGASNMTVLRAARLKIAKKHRRNIAMRPERKKLYRAMLKEHRAAQALVRRFRLI